MQNTRKNARFAGTVCRRHSAPKEVRKPPKVPLESLFFKLSNGSKLDIVTSHDAKKRPEHVVATCAPKARLFAKKKFFSPPLTRQRKIFSCFDHFIRRGRKAEKNEPKLDIRTSRDAEKCPGQVRTPTSESSKTCGFFVVFLTGQGAKLAILRPCRNSRMSALSGFFCFYVMLSSSFKF